MDQILILFAAGNAAAHIDAGSRNVSMYHGESQDNTSHAPSESNYFLQRNLKCTDIPLHLDSSRARARIAYRAWVRARTNDA